MDASVVFLIRMSYTVCDMPVDTINLIGIVRLVASYARVPVRVVGGAVRACRVCACTTPLRAATAEPRVRYMCAPLAIECARKMRVHHRLGNTPCPAAERAHASSMLESTPCGVPQPVPRSAAAVVPCISLSDGPRQRPAKGE